MKILSPFMILFIVPLLIFSCGCVNTPLSHTQPTVTNTPPSYPQSTVTVNENTTELIKKEISDTTIPMDTPTNNLSGNKTKTTIIKFNDTETSNIDFKINGVYAEKGNLIQIVIKKNLSDFSAYRVVPVLLIDKEMVTFNYTGEILYYPCGEETTMPLSELKERYTIYVGEGFQIEN